jgi:hypothetical protein
MENFSKIGKMVNMYNRKDYALNYSKWPLNNVMKPANEPENMGYTFDYNGDSDNYFESKEDDEGDKFFYEPQRVMDYLEIAQGSPEEDRYKIFAYIAESRVKALGTQVVKDAENINLEKYGFDHKHYSHSRQFRSNLIVENSYWQQILRECDFVHDN